MRRAPACRRSAGLAWGLVVVAASGAFAQGADVQLHATLAPDPVGLEESAQLHLEIESRGFRLPEIEPQFRLDRFSQLGGPNRSQSHSWVNGESTSRLGLTWHLRPESVGVGAVRQLRVLVNGESRLLPDLEVRIVEVPPERPRTRRRPVPTDPFRGLLDDDPFAPFRRAPAEPVAEPEVRLRVHLEPTTVWVGQQLLWRLLLETQSDISSFRPRSLPEFAGFWTRELEQPERPTPQWVEVDGERVARFTMMERALFPLRPGTVRIAPTEVGVLARVVDGGPFGRFARDLPLELRSLPIDVTVRPLPPPPSGFASLVGQLNADASLSPGRLEVGRAATYRLTLEGNVHIEGYAPPELDLPAGLRGFAPTRTLEEHRSADRLLSRVEWSYVLVADHPGRFEIAPTAIVFFDPDGGSYRTATTPALLLEVVAAADLAQPPQQEPRQAQPRPPASAHSRRRLPKLALLAAAALAAAALIARRLLHGPGSEAARRLGRSLTAARSQATSRATARALDEAWRLFLADRWDLARSVPTSHWTEHLGRRGIPAAVAADLVALFEELHLLEFAPELADAESMRDDLIERSFALRRRLR